MSLARAVVLLVGPLAGCAVTPAEHVLPRLRVMPLAPLADREGFRLEGGDWHWSGAVGEQARPTLPATDAERIGRRWVDEHFGELPDGTGLVIDEPVVEGLAASGSIVFHQTWRGHRTARFVILWFAGDAVATAHARLGSFEPIAGSARPIVDAAKAKTLLLAAFADVPNPQDWTRLEAHLAPRLEYEFCWDDDSAGGEDNETLAPHWAMLRELPLMVDAHTGRVWRNG